MFTAIVTYCLFSQLCFVEPVEGTFSYLERCYHVGAIETGRLKAKEGVLSNAPTTYRVQCENNLTGEILFIEW